MSRPMKRYNKSFFLCINILFTLETCLHSHLHVFSEVILTLGSSRTVVEFLCAAKEKKRSFRVFVAEGAPRS